MLATDLFTPVQLFNNKLKNRFVLAPLTRSRAGKTCIPNGIIGDYYEQRTPAGLVIVEANKYPALILWCLSRPACEDLASY